MYIGSGAFCVIVYVTCFDIGNYEENLNLSELTNRTFNIFQW